MRVKTVKEKCVPSKQFQFDSLSFIRPAAGQAERFDIFLERMRSKKAMMREF